MDSSIPKSLIIIVSCLLWLLFLFLGIVAIYTRQAAKVKSSQFLLKVSLYGAIVGSLILLTQVILAIVYTLTLCTCKQKGCQNYYPYNIGKDAKGSIIGLELFFLAIQASLFFGLYLINKRTMENMIKFHDYLIAFKQTPRSRIFKRYRPPLETVPEIESQYERSECASIVQSNRQSRMSKMSFTTEKTAKTFKYKDD